MSDTTTPVETVNAGDSQNNGTNNSTQSTQAQGNAVDQAEVERLRKEAEQARIRANQLENEAKKRAEEDEKARLKALEEQNEWKTIAEQERARREALENEQTEAQRKAELETTKNAIFKDFSDDVVELANDAGLDLSDTSEEAQAKLRSSLDKLQTKLAGTAKVTPNNGTTPSTTRTRGEILQEYAQDNRESTFDAALKSIPALEQMRAVNGD